MGFSFRRYPKGFFIPCTPLGGKVKKYGGKIKKYKAKLKGLGQSYIVSKTAFTQICKTAF